MEMDQAWLLRMLMTPCPRSNPFYSIHLCLCLEGFLKNYCSTWVLVHLIRSDDGPPIPKLGKLHRVLS
jgi:hypothetical protein